MKKNTKILHTQIANDTLYYIYEYIDSDINIDDLALDFGLSKFHFHRIFKQETGFNIYETIKSIRLQKASNLLISNKYSSVEDISKTCGYTCSSTFIRAFKSKFNQTPNQWRKGDYKTHLNKILKSSDYKIKDYSFLKPKIIRTSAKKLYYIRGTLDKDSSLSLWQKLITWVYTNNIEDYEAIGVYHDNPVIIPSNNCAYVAAIAVDEDIDIKNTSLPTFITTSDVCACFELEGKYDDLQDFLQWVYHEWLPNSGYETTPNPSYTIMQKNHFLSDDSTFKLKYFIPIRYL